MPRYDYVCPANGRKVEVSHGMSEGIDTWAELCERAGIDPGDTPGEAPVERGFFSAPIIGGIPSSGSGCAPGTGFS